MPQADDGAGLILASQSAARRALLQAAGLGLRVEPARVDEDEVRDAIARDAPAATPADIASTLAAAKAEDVSQRFPHALVIGADQVLAFGNTILTKAHDMAAARSALTMLAGSTHELHCGVVLATGGETIWQHCDQARLTMRKLPGEAIDSYLTRAGDRVLNCVGCYELEGVGVNLFQRIEGDYFTILGLPLLPLLAELRRHGHAAF
ncbi:MAG: Maf family protein [Hyphomicrobiaceae bacterium]